MTDINKNINKIEKNVERKLEGKEIKNITDLANKVETELQSIRKLGDIKGLAKDIKPILNASTIRPIALEKISEDRYGKLYESILLPMTQNTKEKVNKKGEKKGIRLTGFNIDFPKGNKKNQLLYDYSINIGVFGGLMGGIWGKLSDIVAPATKFKEDEAKKTATSIIEDYLNVKGEGLKKALNQVWTKRLYKMIIDILTQKENEESINLANYLLTGNKEKEIVKSISQLVDELHKKNLGKKNKIKSNNVYIIEIVKKENVNTKTALENVHQVEPSVEVYIFSRKDSENDRDSFEINMKNEFLNTLRNIEVYLYATNTIEKLITQDIINKWKEEWKMEKTIFDKLVHIIEDGLKDKNIIFEDTIERVAPKNMKVKVEAGKNKMEVNDVKKIKIRLEKLRGLEKILMYAVINGDDVLDKLNKVGLEGKNIDSKRKIIKLLSPNGELTIKLVKEKSKKEGKTIKEGYKLQFLANIDSKEYKLDADSIELSNSKKINQLKANIKDFYVKSKGFYKRLEGNHKITLEANSILDYYLNNLNRLAKEYKNVYNLFKYYIYLNIFMRALQEMNVGILVERELVNKDKTKGNLQKDLQDDKMKGTLGQMVKK